MGERCNRGSSRGSSRWYALLRDRGGVGEKYVVDAPGGGGGL